MDNASDLGSSSTLNINLENVEDELEKLQIFDGYISDEYESQKVTLTNTGIDLRALKAGEGAEFELDENGNMAYESEEQIDYAQLYQFRNMDMVTGEDDGMDATGEYLMPFDILRSKMTDISPKKDGGIMKRVMIAGIGPLIRKGDLVRINYNAYFELNEEPIDSSFLRNKPFEFRAGTNEVIIGLAEAILTMRNREKSQFIFAPEYYCGKHGCQPRIPADTPVLFEVQIEAVHEVTAYDEFQVASVEERLKFSFEKIMLIVNCLRQLGNDFYERKMYRDACSKYRKAIYLLDNRSSKNEYEDKETQRVSLKLYLNMSQVSLKQNKPKKCIYYCKLVLDIESNNVKALFRYGKSLRILQDFDRSFEYLSRALKYEPNNKEITQELEKLDEQVKKHKMIETDMYKRMFEVDKSTILNGNDFKESNISKATKDLIDKQLNEFKNDKKKMTLKIDREVYTVNVIQYIKEQAIKLGLGLREITGGNEALHVIKE